jgi:transposase
VLVALDEFALQAIPNTGYAWAPKNTAPTVPSDERHRQRLNGSLTVDVLRGTTHAEFRAQSKTDDVVCVVVMTILRYVQLGCRWITVLLDNAPTHRAAMETAVRAVLAHLVDLYGWGDLQHTTVAFWHTPRYSPAYNPAEYLIHWLRQKALYHLPYTFSLQDKADRVKQHLAHGPPLTPEQMTKLLHHIYNLPHSGTNGKWPKLE